MVLAIALVFPAAAFAVDRPPVPNNAYVNGQPLKGLSEAQALAIINQVNVTRPVVVKGLGQTFTWSAADAKKAVSVWNPTAVLDQAYKSVESTATTYTIKPTYTVNGATAWAWAGTIAKKLDRKAVNAKRSVKKRKLVVSAEKNGYAVDKAATVARIKSRLLSEANGGTPPAVSWVAYKTLKPKVTRKNIGKALLVVLGQRRIYLYKNTAVQKKYRCAIGTPRYPTPKGTFKITAKRYRPTWVNPAPNGWGANMPARIAPGPRNPLGTRALNLSASGIRIHGTYKTSSIGRAASHGCMRMLRKDIEDLYPRVSVGTPVYIVK